MHRRPKFHRAGMGILALVAVVLLILFVMGLAQSLFSTQVVDESHREIVGRRCVEIAESAIEEALWKVQTRANTPGDPLFDRFRNPVLGGASGAFPIDLGSPEKTQDLVLDLSGYEIDEVEAAVIARRRATYLEYETCGLLRVAAAATSDLFSTSFRDFRRSVEVLADFRVVKCSPPRPFDRMTLVVRDCGSIVGPGNDEIRSCYDSMRGGDGSNTPIRESLQKIVDGFESVPSPYKEQYQPSVDLLKAHIDWENQAVADSSMGDLALSPSDLDAGRPSEPEGPHLFGYAGHLDVSGGEDLALAVDDDEIDVGSLVIREAVMEREERRLKAWEERNQALDEVSNLSGQSPPDASAVQSAIEKLTEKRRTEVEEAKAILQLYRGLQNATGEITGLGAGGTLASWESRYFTPKLRKSFWRRTASCVVDDGAQLKKLLESLTPLSGVVWVKKGPLRLDGGHRHRGKLVIAVDGNVEIENVQVADGSKDLLSVVAFGDARITGRNQLFLMLAGATRSSLLRVTAESALLEGGLVVSGRMLPVGPTGGAFQLTVKRNALYDGGKHGGKAEDPNHLAVLLSPRYRAKGVYRE